MKDRFKFRVWVKTANSYISAKDDADFVYLEEEGDITVGLYNGDLEDMMYLKEEDLKETPLEHSLKTINFDLESKNSLLKMENERLTKLFQKTLQSKVYQLFLAFPDYDYISCNHFLGVALHKKMPKCCGGAIFSGDSRNTKVLGHDFNPQYFPLEESYKLKQCGKDCPYSGQDDCKSRIYRRKDFFEDDSVLKIMKLKREIAERLNEILEQQARSRYSVGERKEWYNSGYIDALNWVLGVKQ